MVCKMESITSPVQDSDTLDLSNQELEKITRATPQLLLNTTTLLLDNNNLSRLDNIHTYQCLEKLSVAGNKLVRMFQVCKLQHLKVLDMSKNSIVSIEGLKEIKLLSWLSLSENNIKSLEHLNHNIHLEYVDLSANQLTYVTDICGLKNLKTLLLHKNKIGTLRSCSQYLPGSVTTLTLSDNQLLELGDVSHLSHLSRLDQLTLSNNPCIKQPEDIQKQFDYRPYVINWLLHLRMLDGELVAPKESLKAEWMYSQSKGRQFGPGEHEQLVEYLVQTCPSDPDMETEQDRKLNLILSKVQEHQSSLRSQTKPEGYSTLPRSVSADGRRSTPSTPRRHSGSGVLPLPVNGDGQPTPTPQGEGQVGSLGYSSNPSSTLSTPVNTPGLSRRNSTGIRNSRYSRLRNSPGPLRKNEIITPSQYNLELPPTLYGEDMNDVMNGNDLMTQSMDPSALIQRLDNTSSISESDLMSQSVDANMLRTNLNQRFGLGGGINTATRPRTLFSQRSTDSGIRSDDYLELQDVSDGESSIIVSGYSRLQSRLNPVPESLNSPDIVPGPSPPRRDDPLHSGPLSNEPHELELRLSASKNGFNENQKTAISPLVHSSLDSSTLSSLSIQTSPRPSDLMVAAMTARTSTKTTSVMTRPTSAVKPSNVTSKVDSGLNRTGPGRTPIPRSNSRNFDPQSSPRIPDTQSNTPRILDAQSSPRIPDSKSRVRDSGSSLEPAPRPRSQSAGPARKSSLPNRQVAALKSGSTITAPTPEPSRKHISAQPLSLADDEASDTETESRVHNTETSNKPRPRRTSQEPGKDIKGRNAGPRRSDAGNRRVEAERRVEGGGIRVEGGGRRGEVGGRRGDGGRVEGRRAESWNRSDGRRPAPEQRRINQDQMTKSASSMQVGSSSSRPRSTSLTRSQSQRLGSGAVGSSYSDHPTTRSDRSISRPRSSTLSSGVHRGGLENVNTAARSIQAGWRGHNTRTSDPQVREMQDEIRSMRLEAHVKQLNKELRNARAALDQERKLRKVQTDTIRALWKEVQTLQYENDLDFVGLESMMIRSEAQKNQGKKNFRMGRLLPGSQQWQEDSDSSRGDDFLGGSGSSTSGVDDKSVADLSRTCANLQNQVENLQASLATVVRYVSERSRHSSSSTPPGVHSVHSVHQGLPNSMTMSLPPSLTLPNPVTISRSCDSLAQTDIVAVKTPQNETFLFGSRQAFTDVDTSDSDHTRLDLGFPFRLVEGVSTSSFLEEIRPPSRSRSPRPSSLPGVGSGDPATPKKAPPRGTDIPGMHIQEKEVSPPGPKAVKCFASDLMQGILSQSTKEISQRGTMDTADDATDISMSLDISDFPKSAKTVENAGKVHIQKDDISCSLSPLKIEESPNSLKTVDSDSLEKSVEMI